MEYDYLSEEDQEQQCEGGTWWEDDGKGGFDQCNDYNTSWYEFWGTGTAGWYCSAHWPYDSDMALMKRWREQAEKQKAK